jgi:hypothetical protein
MPVKSLPNIDTDVTLGVSVITGSGIPEIGKSRPLEIFITRALPKYIKIHQKRDDYKCKEPLILAFY